MNFKTHNYKEINVNGTSFQGEITATFEKLLKVFGTPLGASSDNKVDVEWNLEVGDVIATIYNWKNGVAHMGSDGTNPVDITRWHIGGKSKGAVWTIEEILESF